MQRRKFIAGALLMSALPYVSFAKATTESSKKQRQKQKTV
jgi:hypothetical protein